MADKKFSELDLVGSLTGTEILPVIQEGLPKRTTVADVVANYVLKSGDTMTGQLTSQIVAPSADSTYTLGTSSLYWKETYTDRLYLNSTAYLDGSTAGVIDFAGGTGDQIKITNTTTTQKANIKFAPNGNNWALGARGSSASNANQFYLYDSTVGAYRLRVATDGNVIATKTISATEYGVSGMLSTFSNEASFYTVMPNLQNDIMYNDLRGGSVTWKLNGGAYSPSSPEQAFRPGVAYTWLVSTADNDTFVCEITTHSTFTWAGVVGHAFYSHTGTYANVIKSVKAEIYLNGAWVTIYDTAITSSDGPVKYARYNWATNTPGVTKLRYTFVASGAGTSRLTQLFWIKYNSSMLSETYLDKSGGSLYGTVTMSDAANLALGTTTGTKIGTATNQKLGFFNAAPVVQPSSTPANATDLATALTLVNDLKSKLVTLGLIA